MKYVLRLYITAQTPNSTRALANIKRIYKCNASLTSSGFGQKASS